MTSSTARSRGVKSTLAVFGLAGLFLVAAHAAFELAATYAESRLGAYLWKQQDYLRLLTPAYHAGRGRGRLFIYGPSEAREGLLPEEIEKALPGLKAYQNAQSIGTLEDGLVTLNYLEAAYGRPGVPDVIVLGITTRFIANIRMEPSPLFEAIKKYSPLFTLDEGSHPPTLVAKSTFDSARSRIRLLALEPDRYRRGLVAVTIPLVRPFVPRASMYERILVRPSKYLVGKLASEPEIRKWLTTPGNFWEAVHAWEPSRDREEVTRHLGLLLAFVSRLKLDLYIVNLPELSWNRELYAPGRYEDYLSIVRSAIGETPFLDLRTFLNDDEFFDDAHPTWSGAERLSKEVAAFVSRERDHHGALGGRW